MQHLSSRWGLAGRGGVRYYALDNEPSLWHTTHRDVHPDGASMDEVFNRAVSYATQIKAVDLAAGQRLLDIFSLHYYPQGGEHGNDRSIAMQRRRNRSTRSLWDQNYVDKTWIATQVRLIPRMKAWVAATYPGLQTAITEHNWGAESHINGATTQADVLGIFGRESLDLATLWTIPAASARHEDRGCNTGGPTPGTKHHAGLSYRSRRAAGGKRHRSG